MDFDQIVNAIDNSNQEASSGQMATILSTMQQLSDSYGAEPSTVQSVLSIVGNYVRALQQKRSTNGYEEAQAVVNQYIVALSQPQAIRSFLLIKSNS